MKRKKSVAASRKPESGEGACKGIRKLKKILLFSLAAAALDK